MPDTKRNKWPFDSIEVEGHFIVPNEEAKPSSVRSYASHRGKDLGKKFKTEFVGHGTKVTRTE